MAGFRHSFGARGGSREAQGSLRRELSDLRKRLNRQPWAPLICERDRVRLDLSVVSVDVFEPDADARARDFGQPGEFLEGLDIPGEEDFEDWLRGHRNRPPGQLGGHRPTETAKPEPPAPPAMPDPDLTWLPQRPAEGPSLAVLGFANLTGDANETYFAEGFKQELVNRLSRLRWLAVIAGDPGVSESSSVARQHAKILGTKYLLDGTLRSAADLIAIDVTLYESSRLQVIWSKRLEIARSIVGVALDECLQEVVAHLGATIDHGEQLSAHEKRPSNANVTDLLWRGRWHLNRLQHADSEAARELFAQALALDHYSSEALINVTHALAWEIWTGRQPAHRVHEMRRLAQRSIRADPGDGRGYWLAGTAETWLGHMQPALDLLLQAVELTPSLAIAHAQIGCTLNLSGKADQAERPLQLARRLSHSTSISSSSWANWR